MVNLLALNGPSDAEADRGRLLPDLNERLRCGDESSLEALMGLYWDRLLSYAQRMVGSVDAAEDLVQESFVRLWNGRRGWTADGNVQAFLYSTTRNLCLNETRRRGVRTRFSMYGRTVRPNAMVTPLESAEVSELEAAARRAIASLPERRREVFELARDHQLSYREIAEIMGVSPQTVANQMSAALAHLRKVLRPYMEGG